MVSYGREWNPRYHLAKRSTPSESALFGAKPTAQVGDIGARLEHVARRQGALDALGAPGSHAAQRNSASAAHTRAISSPVSSGKQGRVSTSATAASVCGNGI